MFAGYYALISPKSSFCHVWMTFNKTLHTCKISTVEVGRQNKISKISSMSQKNYQKKTHQKTDDQKHISY